MKHDQDSPSDQGPFELSASELVNSVLQGSLTRREIVSVHLDRIAALNPELNALVEVRGDAAIEEAEAADAERGNSICGPLDGVPICVKDHFDVAGMKHTEGLVAFAERRSATDAPIVERLRAAGAIVLAKGNQPDIQGLASTRNDIYGVTRNPRDLARSPGGSSGGDAAAVAAGMVPIGFGVDYGGSIRQPAQYCEVYGLRPSAGRVPQVDEFTPDGFESVDLMASAGPIARSVEDIALALEVTSGVHPLDPASVPAPLADWRDARPGKVAVMIDGAGARIGDEVRAAVHSAAAALAAAGYDVHECAPPEAAAVPDLWRRLLGTEAMNFGLPSIRSLLSPTASRIIEAAQAPFHGNQAIAEYVTGLTERRRLARVTAGWMEEFPLILAPVCGEPAPELEYDVGWTLADIEAWFEMYRTVVWANCLGLPALAVPSGAQVIGRRFREDEVLSAAASIEASLGSCTVSGVLDSVRD